MTIFTNLIYPNSLKCYKHIIEYRYWHLRLNTFSERFVENNYLNIQQIKNKNSIFDSFKEQIEINSICDHDTSQSLVLTQFEGK